MSVDQEQELPPTPKFSIQPQTMQGLEHINLPNMYFLTLLIKNKYSLLL